MSAVIKHAEIIQTSKVAKNQYKFPVLDLSQNLQHLKNLLMILSTI